jgi:hypothetical protein
MTLPEGLFITEGNNCYFYRLSEGRVAEDAGDEIP